MRKLSIAATLLVALTGCGALPGGMSLQSASRTAPTPEQRQERAKAAFDRLDADKNGAISLEEFEAARNHVGQHSIASLDKDGDGKVSFDEFKAGKPGNAKVADDKLKSFFDKMDANKDGFLSGDELKFPGHPGFGGFGHRRGPGPMGFMFGADANKDGKLTLDELKAAKGPKGEALPADKVQALFDKLDTNKDGVISKDDRPAHGQKPQAK